jgi:hypothetical protein
MSADRAPSHFAAKSGARARVRCEFVLWFACAMHALLPSSSAQTPAFASSTDNPRPRDDADARRTTMARALFEEGLRLLDAGKWSDAQDRFGRVLELRASPVAVYNLGLAQARLGHVLVAAATLRRLLADATLDAKVRERATTLLNEVEAKFGWLTLRVGGVCDGCSVRVDSEEWPRALQGVAVPIDPGVHTLDLQLALTVLARETVEVAAAGRVEATLSARPSAQQTVQDGQARQTSANAKFEGARASRDTASRPSSPLVSPWFWGAMGVLVAGAVTVLIIGAH